MIARRLRTSLVLAHVAGVVMLLRSIAYDRWISVAVALLLLTGVAGARRGRTWGVALALASAVAFPVFVALGIAPSWFCIVGALGMMPFVIASRAFARFDKGATKLLAALAASAGALVALGWNAFAPTLFAYVPLARPGYDPQHGLAVAAVAGAALAAALMTRRKDVEEARVRIGARVRVATADEAELAYADDFEEEAVLRPRSQPITNARAVTRDASSHHPARTHASRS